MDGSDGTGCVEGGCLCGRFRYRLDPRRAAATICHCATCRRAAGAQSVAWATVPAAAFAWTGPTPAAYASSPGVVRTHCPRCGTSLTFQAEGASIDVTLGSLDEPERLQPASETWLSHRLTWEAVGPGRKEFAGGSGSNAA